VRQIFDDDENVNTSILVLMRWMEMMKMTIISHGDERALPANEVRSMTMDSR